MTMTDTTDPREGGSEYAELLRVLEDGVLPPARNQRLAIAAAIRALEAKVREAKQLHDNALKIVYQACADDVAREVDRVEALAAEVELLRTQAGLPPKYPSALVMHDAHANMVNAELRADRDRLAGEVERLTDANVSLHVAHRDAAAEVARLTSELAAAKKNQQVRIARWDNDDARSASEGGEA